MWKSLGWLCAVVLVSCGEEVPSPKVFDDGAGVARGDCNPVDPSRCAYPFPSSFFLVDDAEMPTGKRVSYGPASLPRTSSGEPLDPTDWNVRDGFSINSALLVYLEKASLRGVVGHQNLEGYAALDAKSVIASVASGERHPHWVEMDLTLEDRSADEPLPLLLRPAMPFEWSTTYVVGLQGLVDMQGETIAAPAAFAALRDGIDAADPDVARQRAHYEEVVFPALEAQGMAREELQMAWSFQTASRQNTLGDMLALREDAFQWLADSAQGPEYVLDDLQEGDCSKPDVHIARHIEGRVSFPYFTTSDDVATYLSRDELGRPQIEGLKEVPFIVRVPCSVAYGADGMGPTEGSAPVLQYGHGLLGDHGEVRSGYLAEIADRYGWVLYASGWTGFKTPDAAALTLMLSFDPSRFGFVPEGSLQGMSEFLLGMRWMREHFRLEDALRFEGVPVLDSTTGYYYGNSQGAIMGSAYVAMSPDVERGVLGVGGAPYSLLLNRSVDFEPFLILLKDRFYDPRDLSLYVNGLLQQRWDPAEAGGWLWDMVRDADEPKQVLLQVALADNQVTPLGAHYQARAYGARLLEPATRDVWGLDTVAPPLVGGSALVEWYYTDVPDAPVEGLPPSEPDPHECVRREREAQDQMAIFFATGVVEQTCDGPCESRVEDVCP